MSTYNMGDRTRGGLVYILYAAILYCIFYVTAIDCCQKSIWWDQTWKERLSIDLCDILGADLFSWTRTV